MNVIFQPGWLILSQATLFHLISLVLEKRSTEDQLIVTYADVDWVDSVFVVDLALLDFSKAFDLVFHDILLAKLCDLGCVLFLFGFAVFYWAGVWGLLLMVLQVARGMFGVVFRRDQCWVWSFSLSTLIMWLMVWEQVIRLLLMTTNFTLGIGGLTGKTGRIVRVALTRGQIHL